MEDNNNDDTYDSTVNSEDSQTLNLSKLEDKISLTFDYEMNMSKLEDKDSSESKILYLDDKTNQYKVINYNLFFDKLRPLPKIKPSKDPKKAINDSSKFDAEFEELDDANINNDNLKKANFFKRLVSKQKRRFQDSNFDLDMSYITDKVIAMGFPSTGMEVMYRNSLSDIIKFFHVRHNDEVKVYNLCLEKDRIYNKNVFPNSKVGLFPATDHNPSPIKLILEFCIDLCLYLIKNPKGVAAVHCKAGKGRTGVMICSYLVFSGLCQTSEKAFRYYARVRTKNNTGVTIASQKRYIKYFETFLESNFYPPYINLIPKIIRSHFSFLIDRNDIIRINNILQSFQREKSYFISSNKFKLKKIRLGPLPKGKELKLKICNFVNNKFKLPKKHLLENKEEEHDGNIYYEYNFVPELTIHSDIKITIKEDLKFFMWVNLWYSTWEAIKDLYDKKFFKNSPSKSVKELNYHKFDLNKNNNEISGEEDEQINNIKINSIQNGFISNEINENEIQLKSNTSNSLYNIIYQMKHNNDLNELIDKINSDFNMGFSRDMTIKLNAFEFDKFHEKNDYSNLEMTIYYSISEK
jgi:protein-tyrosine phosphatase